MHDLTDLFRQALAVEKLKRRLNRKRGNKLTPWDIFDIGGIGSEPHTRYIIATLNGTPWQQAAREAIGVAT